MMQIPALGIVSSSSTPLRTQTPNKEAHGGRFRPDFGNKQRLVSVTKAGGSGIVSSLSPQMEETKGLD